MPRAEPNFIMMADDDDASPVDQLRRRALRLLQQAGDAPEDSGRRYSGFAAPAAMTADRPAPARALAVGVITMPAVFIVVVIAALALFGKPSNEPATGRSASELETLDQPASMAATSATFASARSTPSIALGEDRRVTSIALDGDRIALHVESPLGSEILVYDYVAERVVASAPIVNASASDRDQLGALTGPPPVSNLALIAPTPEAGLEVIARDGFPSPTMKPRGSE